MDHCQIKQKYKFENLPKEIIIKIIQSSENVMECFCTLLKVSKWISKMLSKSTFMWNELKIEYRPANLLTSICSCESRYKNIRTLELFEVNSISWKTLEFISLCCNIDRLSMRYCTPLSETLEHSEIYWPDTLKIINFTNSSIPQLKSVKFTQVERLYMSGCSILTDDLMFLIENCKSCLRELDVSRTHLKPANIYYILENCPNLKIIAATEVMISGSENSVHKIYPNMSILFDLLGHNEDALLSRENHLISFYDIDGGGCSLLADAIQVGIHINLIKKLINLWKLDPNISARPPPPWVCPYPMKYQSHAGRFTIAIHEAISKPRIDVVDLLLEVGADPNRPCPEKNFQSPISLAFSCGLSDSDCLVISQTLLSKGAKFFQEDNNHETAADFALKQSKYVLIIINLVKKGYLVGEDLDKLMLKSVEMNCLKVFYVCLEHKANILSLNKNSKNCLVIALEMQHVEMVHGILKVATDDEKEVLINAKIPPLNWTSFDYVNQFNDKNTARVISSWLVSRKSDQQSFEEISNPEVTSSFLSKT